MKLNFINTIHKYSTPTALVIFLNGYYKYLIPMESPLQKF